jgi:nucleotide-binding universal stress UspA family protein
MSRAPTPIAAQPPPALAGKRILVLFESGRAGTAAIDFARQLAVHDRSTVTVVTVVPQATMAPRCGCGPTDLNAMVRDAAADELEQAQEQLYEIGDRAAFVPLIEGTDPPLHEFVAAAGFELIVLPARRRPLRSTKHPAAAALSRTGAEVQIVDPRADPSPAMV